MRRTIQIEDADVEVLAVPFFAQQSREAFCFEYSFKMCLEFYKNYHQDANIRTKTPALSVDDIINMTKARVETGTRISDDLTKSWSKTVNTLNVEQHYDIDFKYIEARLDKNLPSIVIYNCDYLETGNKGSAHAGVVIGMTKDQIILNNPWLGECTVFKKNEFLEAWEIEYRRVICVDPNPVRKLSDFDAAR